MIEILVKRTYLTDTYTEGKMFINGEYFCDTLEDTVRTLKTKADKVYGETAIPEGTYEVKMTYSNKMKRILPILLNVPFFTGIRIHAGNTADKDSLGCILVGVKLRDGYITKSKVTENKLVDILKEENDIKITIVY